jgi:hypothetical protein
MKVFRNRQLQPNGRKLVELLHRFLGKTVKCREHKTYTSREKLNIPLLNTEVNILNLTREKRKHGR